MLREIQDTLGIENIKVGISNVEVKNSVVIIVGENETKIINTDNMEDIEDMTFVKERVFYSEYINSNKSVVVGKSLYPRVILTANKFSVGFNINTLLSKIEIFKSKATNGKTEDEIKEATRPALVNMINEYYDFLGKYTEDVSVQRENIINNIDIILNEIIKKENEKKAIKIFITGSLDEYKEEFGKYFNARKFDSIVEEGVGRVGYFLTLNNKKPLLKKYGGITSEIQIYRQSEVYDLYKLKYFFEKNFKVKNKLIVDGESSIIVNYNPKEKYITEFSYNPFLTYNDSLGISIVVKDVLGNFNNKEDIIIEGYSKLVWYINKYVDFSLTVEDVYSDSKLIYNRFGSIIIYKTTNKEKTFYYIDIELFIKKLPRLLDAMVSYNHIYKTANKDNYYRFREVMNYKIHINEHFKIEESVKVSDLIGLRESFKEKVLMFKEVNVLDSTEEALFAAGQLAAYLGNKSKGKGSLRIIAKYSKLSTFGKLTDYLNLDLVKYGYDISTHSRAPKIYSCILATLASLTQVNMTKKEKALLLLGLYADNLLYTKEVEEKKQLEEQSEESLKQI